MVFPTFFIPLSHHKKKKVCNYIMVTDGFPDGLEIKNIFLSRRHGFDSWAWKIPWRKNLQPTPIFLLGKFHGQRNLVGYLLWGHKRVTHYLATKKQNNIGDR